MASTLENLAAKGLAKAEQYVADGKWFDQLVSRGEAVVAKVGNEDMRGGMSEALSALTPLKPHLAGMGEERLTAFVGYLGLGDTEKARHVYLAEQAGLGELFAASRESTDEIVAARAVNEARKAAFQEVAITIGKVALKLLPILLAAA